MKKLIVVLLLWLVPTIAFGQDLMISSMSLPSTSGAGATINISDTTWNGISTTAGESVTGFFLSTNPTLDAGDMFLGDREVPVLSAFGFSSGMTTVVIPLDTLTGAYHVIAKADYGNNVVETIETNNVRSKQILIGPDLRISAMTIHGSFGTPIGISSEIWNSGSGTSGGSTINFYLSANTILDAGDTLLGSRVIPALAPNATSYGSTAVSVPAGTPPGNYYIIGKADSLAEILETSESNNTTYRTLRQ